MLMPLGCCCCSPYLLLLQFFGIRILCQSPNCISLFSPLPPSFAAPESV
ncbi:hypothetical protein V6Z12_A01G112100 [Gossypium hirsutum]